MAQIKSPEEFAECAAEQIIEPIADGTLTLDRDYFSLVIKSGTGKSLQTINLARFYTQYTRAPESINEILSRISNISRENLDLSDFNKVAPFLMPVIGDRSDCDLTWRKAYKEYGDAAGRLQISTVCEYFALYPVVDTGDTQVRIPSQVLDKWPVTYQEVLARAGQNLIDKTEHHNFESFFDTKDNSSIIHQSIWKDGYDAMRTFYFDMAGLEVKGERLFLLLDQGTLVCWDSESDHAAGFLMAMLHSTINNENSIFKRLPPFILHRKDGALHIYVPNPNKEPDLHRIFKQYQTRYLADSYQKQREFLNKAADIQLHNILVSKFKIDDSKDSDPISYSVWTEGIDCLLPKTDKIAFARRNSGDNSTEIVAQANWDDVKTLLHNWSAEVHLFPPRFKTSEFPTDSQLQYFGVQPLN